MDLNECIEVDSISKCNAAPAAIALFVAHVVESQRMGKDGSQEMEIPLSKGILLLHCQKPSILSSHFCVYLCVWFSLNKNKNLEVQWG